MFEEVVVAVFYTLDPATGEYTLLREFMSPSFGACVDLAWDIARAGGDLVVECVYYVGKAGEPT